MVLWVFWSYGIELWGIAPLLAFLSPEKRCGKTSLLSLLACLLDRALLTSNTSASAIFRVVEAARPTLIIDEMDSYMETDEALRGILNSGHTKTAAKVIRVQGEQLEVKEFSTWCPKILAAIGTLPDTIIDRSVVIRMKRRTPDESIEKLRWAGRAGAHLRGDLKRLAAQCKRWVMDHTEDLMAANPTLPDALNDRAADNWYPLLSIAIVLGNGWPDRATSAAHSLNGGNHIDSDSIKTQLLQDIRAIINDLEDSKSVWSQNLCDRLAVLEERPWGEWSKGKPMTQTQLARQLRPFGVLSRDIRLGNEVKKGYEIEALLEVFTRYISPCPEENDVSKRDNATKQPRNVDSSLFQGATGEECRGSENPQNASLGKDCSGVANQNKEIVRERMKSEAFVVVEEREVLDLDL